MKPTASALTPATRTALVALLRTLRALCFEGGGARGQLYLELLRVFQELGLDLTKIEVVVGSSAGVLSAGPIAFGLSAEQIQEVQDRYPVERLIPRRRLWTHPVETLKRWWRRDGVLDSSMLLEFINALLEAAGLPHDVTFEGLRQRTGKTLAITTTAIGCRSGPFAPGPLRVELRVWSPVHTPEALVAPAMLASTAIPYGFAPVELSHPGIDQGAPCLHGDGGLFANLSGQTLRKLYPKLNGEDEATWQERLLLVRVDNPEEVGVETAPFKPVLRVGKLALARAIVTSLRRECLRHAVAGLERRVLVIPSPLQTIDGSASPEQLEAWVTAALEAWAIHARRGVGS